MSVKLIAVDMDGTFLSDTKTYNRPRFLAQYARMKAQGIRFVVASGNQYYQLISFFPEIAHEIAFVAENGGWVVSEGEDVFNGELSKAHFETVANVLTEVPGIEIIACGKSSAYTLKCYDEGFKDIAAKYYHRLEMVSDFDNLNDIFFKFGLNVSDDDIPRIQAMLHEKLNDIMVPVTTGHGSIDLIIPGVHKANGLRILVDNKVDFEKKRNLVIASVILVIGIGGTYLKIGSFQLTSIGLATVFGILLNLILPGKAASEQ